VIEHCTIRVAYYSASDGPRIMLFGPIDVDFLPLQDCFRRLSKGAAPTDLQTQPFVFVAGDVQLRMETSGEMFRSDVKSAALGLRRICADSNHFTWTRTNEGWDYLCELINSSVISKSPGHQYLTSHPDDDAIVVISRGEYGDEVLAT
jgi:hypothetical protein